MSDQLYSVIAELYRAPLGETPWAEALAALSDALRSTGTGLYAERDGRLIFAEHGRLPTEGVDRYLEYYWSIDPRVGRVPALQVGQIFTDLDFITESQMDRHEYYQDFLAPLGFRYFIGGLLAKRSSLRAYYGVQRSLGKTAPDQQERRTLEILQPHLRAALELHLRLGELESEVESLVQAIDRLSTGVVLLNRDGQVLALNAAAEGLIARRDGLVLEQGMLGAQLPHEAVVLSTAVAAAIDLATGAALVGSNGFRVSRPSGRAALVLTVIPLPTALEKTGGAVAAIMIADPERGAALPAEVIRTLFGLTPAEAHLAIAISGGETLKNYARTRGVSINTIRAQLARIMAKTGTKRQPELVSLLIGSVPPVREP